MSNQAAAAVVIPVALQTALQLGLNPRTFAMMIAIAASTSYLTPLEPACLMVYGPGRYRFMDFLQGGRAADGGRLSAGDHPDAAALAAVSR